MSFIENAKKVKKEKKITTGELSARCGIPLGTLSKLFSGVIEEPKLSAAVAIASALDTSVDVLCGIETDEMTPRERDILSRYRSLDTYGQNLVDLIIQNECRRMEGTPAAPADSAEKSIEAKTPETEQTQKKKHVFAEKPLQKKPETESVPEAESTREAVITPSPAAYTFRTIPLFDTPVSAGTGEYLEDQRSSTINIKNTGRATEASFALRVSGDSMMPEFVDGDILLVKQQPRVEAGQFGIFICDGQGYFKKFGGDRLISLNPAYSDLPLSDFDSTTCAGLVLGRLKSRKSQ